MPDYIYNCIKFTASEEDLEKVKEMVKEGDCLFSFNKIVPMPKDLDLGDVPGLYGDFEPKLKSDLEHAIKVNDEINIELLQKKLKMFENKRNYGYESWYDWCPKNWGSKWPALEIGEWVKGDGNISITFRTAWAPPNEIFYALSRTFDELKLPIVIDIYWAQEYIGFTGYQKWENACRTEKEQYEKYGSRSKEIRLICNSLYEDDDEEEISEEPREFAFTGPTIRIMARCESEADELLYTELQGCHFTTEDFSLEKESE